LPDVNDDTDRIERRPPDRVDSCQLVPSTMLPLLISLSFLAPAALAAIVEQETRHQPVERQSLVTRGKGYLAAPVHAYKGTPKLPRRLKSRQETEPLENHQLGTTYTVDIEIGTPGQTVTVILDTGSPDLWVNPTCSTSGQPAYCRQFPRFDPSESSSLVDDGFRGTLRYGKGNVSLAYVTDTITIGSAQITEQMFGVARESHDIPMGILGLSTAVDPERGAEYPYVLDTMAEQGLINSRAFSLDLRAVDTPEGAIIFGGVDTRKFIGALAKLPIVEPQHTPLGADRYYVNLTAVGITYPNGSTEKSGDFELPIFLDSGGTLSQVPPNIFQAIGQSVPTAQFDPASGFYLADCSIKDEPGSVDFSFGDKTIRVAYPDFIWEVEGFCVVGVLPTEDEPIFGDTFLRAAYVVYDQENRNLHIAQAANCGTDIIEIGTGPDAVPSSTGQCTTTATRTDDGGGTRTGSPDGNTTDRPGPGGGSDNPDPNQSSNPAAPMKTVGVAAMAALVAINVGAMAM